MNEQDIKAVREPIPQMDKVYAVLDQIEADPEHWDQTQWTAATECGTTMCFAGWACALEGLEVKPGRLYVGGQFIADAARKILGLTREEDHSLFEGTIFNDDDCMLSNRIPEERALMLENVKIEVAKISARAKEQQAAFERVAKELIESVPELEDVLKPGYLCPESRELVMQYLGGQDGGN